MTERDPYAALRIRNVRYYLAGNLMSILGVQMQTTAVQWEIWNRSHSKLALAMVGLVQVIPVITLALIAGHVADRFDRRNVITLAVALIMASSMGLLFNSLWQGPLVVSYVCLLANGVARAFQQPSKSSFFPQLMPREVFPNAVTWNMGGFQLASVAGPAIAGGLLAWHQIPALVYGFDAVASLVFILLLATVDRPARTIAVEPATLASTLAGARFVWQNKVLLGAMALDMFAVLLGGATTLLPVYADEVLKVNATGYGWLRSMPAIGALVTSFILTRRPPMERAGAALLWAVAGFGLATIVFGLSTSFALSLVMLFLTGALDMISVVIRHTLVQLQTPEAMRGRVSAVNGMFISASNELGGFESGLLAHYTSAVTSVVAGGIGTILVVAFAAAAWPQLRRFGRLAGPVEEVEANTAENAKQTALSESEADGGAYPSPPAPLPRRERGD